MSNERVFELSVPEGFEWALPLDPDGFDVVDRFLSDPDAGAWEPLRMKLLKSDVGTARFRHAYLPWMCSGVIVLRDEAIEAVGSLLQPHGRLLPLTCDDARLALFLAPAVAGALDEDRSELVRFGSGRIMDLIAPVFHPEVISRYEAFRLAQMPRGKVFLREQLVQKILATKMTSGTEFIPV